MCSLRLRHFRFVIHTMMELSLSSISLTWRTDSLVSRTRISHLWHVNWLKVSHWIILSTKLKSLPVKNCCVDFVSSTQMIWKPEAKCYARATGFNKSAVQKFCELLGSLITKHHIDASKARYIRAAQASAIPEEGGALSDYTDHLFKYIHIWPSCTPLFFCLQTVQLGNWNTFYDRKCAQKERGLEMPSRTWRRALRSASRHLMYKQKS